MGNSKLNIPHSLFSFPRYPRYKDSGVEWLGEVPKHWEVEKGLRFFFETEDRSVKGDEELLSVSHLTGVTPRSEKNITMFMAESYEGSKLCDVGDIAINTMWAWMFALGVSKYRGLVSPSYGTYRQRKPERFNPTFLDHLIRTDVYRSHYTVNSTGITTSRLRLYPHSFLRLKFLCPPLEEQNRIVAFLDQKTAEIDALIAKKQRQIELLDEQKAILINRAVTRGLNPNAKLKPSGVEWIGEIPESWEVLRVKHRAIYFTSGSRGWGDFYSDEGDVFLQSGDLTNNCTISLVTAKRVKLPRKAEGLRTRLQTNDTVVCITGANTGRVANVGKISEKIYVNQHLCLVRPSKEIDHRYLSLALSGKAGRTYFSLCQYGLKEGLSLDDVKNCSFPAPPLAEQREILGYINEISSSIETSKDSTKRQIQSLRSFRSTIIAQVVTGRLRCLGQNP